LLDVLNTLSDSHSEQLCLARHNHYEYYGDYPALYLIPSVIGFFLLPIADWCVKCKRP
jgi:hypothetical protein